MALKKDTTKPGSILLRALIPPFHPSKAQTVGSITKRLLSDLGVPKNIFGPHSTTGAAVKMFKKLGLTSDQVAQLGQWKNLEAFSKHYLRLGSVQAASEKVDGIVHRVVPQGNCAEPAWPQTPAADQAPGGSYHKGGAQEHCEPTRPPKEKATKKRQAPSDLRGPGGGAGSSGSPSNVNRRLHQEVRNAAREKTHEQTAGERERVSQCS